ncbi:hypothetical protein MNB_SM-3-1444 [hydrothermal vent metagenome]|uniref:Uncharacterized protein n=1 Tax=hydrothermal vent metagenome TaxID=652676 RepID=A0A1W1D271_9ZZZZ
MKRYSLRNMSLLLVGALGIGVGGCGINSDSNSSDNSNTNSTATVTTNSTTTVTTSYNSPFLKLYERKNDDNNGSRFNVTFTDGIELPDNGDYLVFGTGSIDKYDTNKRGDDALYARISSKDGTLQSANYVAYNSADAQADLNEGYIRAAKLSYEQEDGTSVNNVVLVGTATSTGWAGETGLLVTLLNGDGSYKWSKFYQLTDGNSLFINSVAADSDGTFWVVGNGFVPAKDKDGYIYTTNLGVVIHIDAKTGAILNSEHIGIDDSVSNYSGVVVANGQVYITGTSYDEAVDKNIDPDGGGSNTVLLLELNKDGTLKNGSKYIRKGHWGETGDGIGYKNGSVYIAYETNVYGMSEAYGGILKVDDTNIANLQKAMEIYSTSPYSYYRDFEISGDNIYLTAAHNAFYQIDLYGNIKKVASTLGAWRGGMFVDSSNNIITFGNGTSPLAASFVTKFPNDLNITCNNNTLVSSPEQNATDVTEQWFVETIDSPYETVGVGLATNNANSFEQGSALDIITQTNECNQ